VIGLEQELAERIVRNYLLKVICCSGIITMMTIAEPYPVKDGVSIERKGFKGEEIPLEFSGGAEIVALAIQPVCKSVDVLWLEIANL